MKYDDETKQRVADLYRSGMPFRKIVEETGVGMMSVRKFVREAGIKSRPAAHFVDRNERGDTPRQAEMRSLYEAGMSPDEIALHLGDTSATQVSKILRKIRAHAIGPYAGNWTVKQRIAQYSECDDEHECWEWTGSKDKAGRPRINIDGIAKQAHRIGYMEYVGPIPDGLTLDHLCGNHGCVNPWHLEPVTDLENNRRGGEPHFEMKGLDIGSDDTPEQKRCVDCLGMFPRTTEYFYANMDLKDGLQGRCKLCARERRLMQNGEGRRSE